MKKQHSAIEVRHLVHQLRASARSLIAVTPGNPLCFGEAFAPSPRVGSFQAGLPYGANRSRNRASEWAGKSLTAGANRVTHASQN